MPCRVCDHTLETVSVDTHRIIRHCPRCGSLQSIMSEHEDFTVPKLVACLRAFARTISSGHEGQWLRVLMQQYGISESILTPEERPKVD